MTRLPPLTFLRTFEAAARHLSFRKAAEEIHVTPAAVSQQIKALEDYLGFPLFHRLTRALALTERGAAMQPKIREAFDCLAQAFEAARQAQTSLLTVTAPPSFASRWLVPRLPRFAGAHPQVEVRLSSSAATIGRRGDSLVREEGAADLTGRGAEVAILYGTGPYPGCRVDKILAADYVPVCVPRLLEAEPPLRTPEDLRHHPLIHDETLGDGERRPSWEAWLRIAGVTGIDARRGPRFANAALAREAALDGQGVVLALRPLIEADLAAGRLAVPFDITLRSPYAYFLVVPEAVAEQAVVEAFRDWLLAEVAPLPASRA